MKHRNPQTYPYTSTTSVSGLSVTIDPDTRNSTNSTSSCTFQWPAGSIHTVTTTSPQTGAGGAQYAFTSWSDGGAITHNITVPASATTLTANFTACPTCLPAGWSSQDIGTPYAGGSASYSVGPYGSHYTVSGPQVIDGSSSLQYVFRQAGGDLAIVAHLSSFDFVSTASKTGLMFRENLTASAKYAYLIADAGGAVQLQYTDNSGYTYVVGQAYWSGDIWLKLARQGNTFSASTSSDGITWTPLGSGSMTIASSAYVGLAVSATPYGQAATAYFGNVSVNVTNQPPVTAAVTPGGSTLPTDTFTFAFSDPNGYADLSVVRVRINSSASDVGACSFEYNRAADTLSLWNDAGTGWAGSITLAPGNFVENSQCIVFGGGKTSSGTTLNLAITVAAKSGFGSTKNIYESATDVSGARVDWQIRGTWTPGAGGTISDNPQAPNVQATDSGKGPPNAGGLTCGAPNCTWMNSSLTYASPNLLYGESTTSTTGPQNYNFLNFTSARMADDAGDLGLACTPLGVSAAGNVASSRVPCDTRYYFNPSATKRYTLTGTHRGVAYGSDVTRQTFDTLGFVAAGTSKDFTNIPMGPFSDFRNAQAPVVSSNDGVTVSYMTPSLNTVNTVSVRVNVPYSARKGRHQFTFPTTDIYGNSQSNPYFAVVVYDPTPVIASVSPSTIPAGIATTLTLTGTGFGDGPTVYVGGAAYNAGVPTRNPQGQDVVTVSVTLPSSQAGSPVSVYLRSNGAGGQAFFGEPKGSLTLGSPNSNTVQVQVQSPPTISGPTGMWWFGPDFVPNNGYQNAAQLTVTAGAGGSPPSVGTPAQWTVTANSDLVSFGCTDLTCVSAIFTSRGPTLPCANADAKVKVRVTLDGVSSSEYPLVIDEPDSLQVAKDWDGTDIVRDLKYQLNGFTGYETLVVYNLLSKCGQTMVHVAVNEEFTNQGRYTPNNWTFLANNDSSFLHYWDSNNGFQNDTFTDHLITADPTGPDPNCGGGSGLVPPPCIPGPERVPKVPLSTDPLIWQTQIFRAGSTTIGQGIVVQQDSHTSYQDHGRNEGAFKPF